MSDSTSSTKLTKAAMPFNFFHKRKSSSSAASTTSKMVPATPKMKIDFSRKTPVTPTLTDASARGDQRRMGILEAQLKEVSLTASKAYDQIEDLKLKNSMLEDQVLQQKQLIESFNQQLEEAHNEKKEFKSFKDNVMKENLEKKGQDSETISKLESDNEALRKEIFKMRKDIETYKSVIKEKDVSLQNIKQLHEKEIREKDTQLKEIKEKPQKLMIPPIQSIPILQTIQPKPSRSHSSSITSTNTFSYGNEDKANQYRDIINQQKKKILELESELDSVNSNHEKSLIDMKTRILVLQNNQMFLSNDKNITPIYGERLISKDMLVDADHGGEGDTFIVSNLSFLP